MIHRRRGSSSNVQRRFQAHFSDLSPIFLRTFVILLTGTALTSQSNKFCDLKPLCRIRYEIQPFSDFGQKKCPLDALNHRTLVYSHGIKSCDSCASKRHLSRVTSIYYAASTPITSLLFFTLHLCFSFSGILPFRLRTSISPRQQWSL